MQKNGIPRQYMSTTDPMAVPSRPGILRVHKSNDKIKYNHHCLNMRIDARQLDLIYPNCTYSYHEFSLAECQEYKYPRKKVVKT